MKTFNLLLILVLWQALPCNANPPSADYKNAFLSVFKKVGTNFNFLNNTKPFKIGKSQNFYRSKALSFPHAKEIVFVENKLTQQRYMVIILDFDMNTKEGRSAFEWEVQPKVNGLFPYWIQAYNYEKESKKEHYFLKERAKKDLLIGGFTFEEKNGQAIIKIYPFSGSLFLQDLKKVVLSGVENNFASHKQPDYKSADKICKSTFNFYRANYSVFAESANGYTSHSTMIAGIPNLLCTQIFGTDDKVISKLLGSDYKITDFKYEKVAGTISAKKLLILMYHNGKKVSVQIDRFENFQKVAVYVK